jgi:hypothetical protein
LRADWADELKAFHATFTAARTTSLPVVRAYAEASADARVAYALFNALVRVASALSIDCSRVATADPTQAMVAADTVELASVPKRARI